MRTRRPGPLLGFQSLLLPVSAESVATNIKMLLQASSLFRYSVCSLFSGYILAFQMVTSLCSVFCTGCYQTTFDSKKVAHGTFFFKIVI